MQDTKTASFLVVNYNSTENVNRLVAEIKSNFSYPYEILVFDNSLNFICADNTVKIYKTDKNVGFGNAHNYLSLHAKYDYLFILNPDITIKHNLNEVLDQFVKLPVEYAVISLNNAEKLYKTPFLGRIIDTEKRFSSNAFVVGKEYFKSIGGFNPKYFMYFEDNEFALELKKFNLKTVYPTKKYVSHIKNYGFREGLKRKMMYYESFLYYLKSNFKYRFILFYIPLKMALLLSKNFK